MVPLRPATHGPAPAEWQERLSGSKPVVYVTLGTQFNEPGRFALLLEAVGAVDCTAVVTVGADQDPAALRPPAHMLVERYIPQADVLPLADAVLCHGGSGSMLAALAHGLPLVLLPAGADQFENAGACSRAGAAIELRPPSVTVDSIRSALDERARGPDVRQGREQALPPRSSGCSRRQRSLRFSANAKRGQSR